MVISRDLYRPSSPQRQCQVLLRSHHCPLSFEFPTAFVKALSCQVGSHMLVDEFLGSCASLQCIPKQSRVAWLLICVIFRWQRDPVPRINPPLSTTQGINPDPSTTYSRPFIATEGLNGFDPFPPELYFNCIHLVAVCECAGEF